MAKWTRAFIIAAVLFIVGIGLLQESFMQRSILTAYINSVMAKDTAKKRLASTPWHHRPNQEGMSACLLVKDNNQRLIEWIAYHYHVLPLRYLVVAVLPRSRTSPLEILSRWNSTELGLKTVMWTNDEFLPPNTLREKKFPDNATVEEVHEHLLSLFIRRQNLFYRECIKHLAAQNRTWTVVIDVDEYIAYNHVPPEEIEDHKTQKYSHAKARLKRNLTVAEKEMWDARTRLPTVENGTLMEHIEKEKNNLPWNRSACITFMRLRFGNKDSLPDEVFNATSHISTDKIEPMKLDTIRYRYHAKRHRFDKNKWAKTMIDVSRLPPRLLQSTPPNPHHLYHEICDKPYSDEAWETQAVVANHYISSFESHYFMKEDTINKYTETTTIADDNDDIVRPWLEDFVDVHGEERASELLKDVGDPFKAAGPIRDENGTDQLENALLREAKSKNLTKQEALQLKLYRGIKRRRKL